MNSRAVIQFEKAGFAVFPDILDEAEICEISRQLLLLGTANAGTRRKSFTHRQNGIIPSSFDHSRRE